MGTKNKLGINQIIGTAVVAAGLSASLVATAKVSGLSRGADVGELAGNCGIAKFPQTSKAGGYNAICDEMQDAEKCLALIKQHFNSDGSTNVTHDAGRMRYCLGELADVLDVNP